MPTIKPIPQKKLPKAHTEVPEDSDSEQEDDEEEETYLSTH
jgi:hypothetical protein